jgi:ribosomal protein S12 methylthiotransferase
MVTKPKVCLISLGCAKNQVDSEHILGLIDERGYPVVSRIEAADIAVLNTCGFVQPAVEESIGEILELCARKQSGALKRIIVVGCMVQRYGYKLRREMPEVDAWLGTGAQEQIGDLLAASVDQTPPFHITRPTVLADHMTPRLYTKPSYSAYLKIAEGCDHHCAYCMIPRLRGSFRSRALESIVAEAGRMVDRGVKEINLIAQDTTMYGRDLEGRIGLEAALKGLLNVGGLRWIRILYAHPMNISDSLLDLIDQEEAICPYLDIPFQHVNEKLLRAMGRAAGGESPWELIERIRSRGRSLSIRTTFMVGFPGETETQFEELLGFVRWAAFDHLGVFVFSPEAGTSAARLGGRVKAEVAQRRQEAIMALQAELSKAKNRQLIGQVIPVLIEGPSAETDLLLAGRTARMAPDVDGRVLINKGEARVGEIVAVRINEAYEYDLVGEIVENLTS